jgi:hypothetical protein
MYDHCYYIRRTAPCVVAGMLALPSVPCAGWQFARTPRLIIILCTHTTHTIMFASSQAEIATMT